MASRSLRQCAKPGCGALSHKTRCPRHEQEELARLNKDDVKRRGTAADRGYKADWRRISKEHLSQHPYCAHCYSAGKLVNAVMVDHIVPHRGDETLRLDPDNRQSLCFSCHEVKKRIEKAQGLDGYRAPKED